MKATPAGNAQRAVLVAPRTGSELATPRALEAMNDAMMALAEEGIELLGIVDPKDHMIALRMLVDGVVDRVVATRPDHLPSIRFTGDEAWFRPGVAGSNSVPATHQRRTRLIPRPDPTAVRTVPVSSTVRRPGIVGGGEAGASDHESPRTRRPQPTERTRMIERAQPEIAQAVAQPESRTPLTDFDRARTRRIPRPPVGAA